MGEIDTKTSEISYRYDDNRKYRGGTMKDHSLGLAVSYFLQSRCITY